MLLEPSYGKRPMNLLAQYLLCYAFLMFLPFIITSWLSLYLVIIWSEISFWGVRCTHICFLYLPFAWNIIFSSFILSLYVFLELKQVSWRHRSSVLIFNPPHDPVHFDLVSSIHLHLRWLLICKNILLFIYLLSFDCFISPLFLFSCASVFLIGDFPCLFAQFSSLCLLSVL